MGHSIRLSPYLEKHNELCNAGSCINPVSAKSKDLREDFLAEKKKKIKIRQATAKNRIFLL